MPEKRGSVRARLETITWSDDWHLTLRNGRQWYQKMNELVVDNTWRSLRAKLINEAGSLQLPMVVYILESLNHVYIFICKTYSFIYSVFEHSYRWSHISAPAYSMINRFELWNSTPTSSRQPFASWLLLTNLWEAEILHFDFHRISSFSVSIHNKKHRYRVPRKHCGVVDVRFQFFSNLARWLNWIYPTISKLAIHISRSVHFCESILVNITF